MLDLPATASALLAELATAADTPEPSAFSLDPSWPDYATDGPGDGALYDAPPLTRLTPAQLAVVVEMMAEDRAQKRVRVLLAERAEQAAQERATLLARLLETPTPQEREPVKECRPGKALRWNYLGMLP